MSSNRAQVSSRWRSADPSCDDRACWRPACRPLAEAAIAFATTPPEACRSKRQARPTRASKQQEFSIMQTPRRKQRVPSVCTTTGRARLRHAGRQTGRQAGGRASSQANCTSHLSCVLIQQHLQRMLLSSLLLIQQRMGHRVTVPAGTDNHNRCWTASYFWDAGACAETELRSGCALWTPQHTHQPTTAQGAAQGAAQHWQHTRT
jgi:hypothetical protein